MIYEALRAGMTTSGPLSLARLVTAFEKDPSDLEEQYVGEVMIASMYGATLAVDRSTSRWLGARVIGAMKAEFLAHIREQGASPQQVKEWEAVLLNRFEGYMVSLEGYEGFEPPWKLGRQFLWNVLGQEEYVAKSIKLATMFIYAARDVAQDLLNKYGPTLEVGVTGLHG